MALFQRPAKPAAPAAPPPPKVPPVPEHLPKITAPTAADITKQSNPSPAAQALVKPQQTPSQYLNALQDKQMGDEMVKTMAHGMPDREGVWWASKSAEHVQDKLPPEDVSAMKAAQTWVKSPTAENKAAAAEAAGKTNYRGPGAWAAQGAAWAQPATPAAGQVPAGAAAPAAAAPATVAMPRMTPHAVTGAVLLSSAIKANPTLAAPTAKLPAVQAPALTAPTVQAPQMAAAPPQTPAVVPPEVQAQTFQQQHPFIAMGIDIASGKSSWA